MLEPLGPWEFLPRPVVVRGHVWDGTEESLASLVAWMNTVLVAQGDRPNARANHIDRLGSKVDLVYISCITGTINLTPGDWCLSIDGEFVGLGPGRVHRLYEQQGPPGSDVAAG
jgi:hypothetical protein